MVPNPLGSCQPCVWAGSNSIPERPPIGHASKRYSDLGMRAEDRVLRRGLEGPVGRWPNRGLRRTRRSVPAVKTAAPRPINGPMRVSRIAPFLALALAAAAAVGAVQSSRADDWREPAVVALLFGIAALADRFQITTRSGTVLVGSLPIFVLAAAVLGPAPGVAVAAGAALAPPPQGGAARGAGPPPVPPLSPPPGAAPA